ncbi:SHOCT domain-containing protein [Pseudarthrobacter oxydans]|uniref:SHOCT domain-containing protein n=1 Tax=Pseudarthrobacter oxydans TaxID=1671 RepID=UPI0038217F8F
MTSNGACTMDVLWTILVIGGLLALMIWGFNEQSKERSAAKDAKGKFLEQVKADRSFTPSRVHDDKNAYLGVDSERGKIYLGIAPQWKSILIPAEKIMSVAIYEDGQSVTHASRMRQIGGALVGNALAPNKGGAVIGALGAKNTTVDVIKSLVLRLEVDDPKNPILGISFLRLNEVKRGSSLHQMASTEARAFSSLITAIMRRSEQKDASDLETQTPPPFPRANKLDELSKLAELRDRGVLSEEEFAQEKLRILNSPSE